MSYWHTTQTSARSIDAWKDSIRMACHWIADVAMIRTKDPDLTNSSFKFADRFTDWRGAFRGEYRAATKHWDVFCPIWHGGQGVKALAMASQVLDDSALLDAARCGADFILRHQVSDRNDEDFGLILAYEGGSDAINTSAILESLEGLFELHRITGEQRYADAAVAALRWVAKKVFLPDEGLFRDDYDPVARKVITGRMTRLGVNVPGRPLLDDGVFITGWKLTGDEALKDVAVRVADRLLRDEDPPGNWKRYPPANRDTGVIHPRHAYWWGLPMWMVHQATGDQRYLDCAGRSAQWYARAMRTDGGLFRQTGPDFDTPSFGHATSGIACAARLWMDLAIHYQQDQWLPHVGKALCFCHSVQFENPADPNLKGAILEKVMPPGRSDSAPWYLRDVGTFFYVQAVCQALNICPQAIT